MRWNEILRAATRDVGRRPLRNGLAALGVSLATALLVALLSLSAGVRSGIAQRLEAQPLLTLVQVTPATPTAGQAPKALDDAAIASLRQIGGVRDVLAMLVVPATLRIGDASPGGTIAGLSVVRRAPYALVVGRALEPSDVDAVVLTPAALRSVRLDIHDVVGRSVSIDLRRSPATGDAGRKSIAARVVGVAADEIPGLAVVPLPLAEDALAWIETGESDAARDLRLAQQAAATLLVGGRVAAQDLVSSRYTSAWLLAAPDADLRAVVSAATAQGYAAFSPEAASRTVEDLFAVVNAGLAAISLVALLVAALGVINALLTSVSERTVEIGVLKAIGASDADVERLFLTEAALIGVFAGLAGALLGWAAASGTAVAASSVVGASAFAPRLDGGLTSIAIAAAIVLSLAAGWIPARRAARLLPAVALRAE